MASGSVNSVLEYVIRNIYDGMVLSCVSRVIQYNDIGEKDNVEEEKREICEKMHSKL